LYSTLTLMVPLAAFWIVSESALSSLKGDGNAITTFNCIQEEQDPDNYTVRMKII